MVVNVLQNSLNTGNRTGLTNPGILFNRFPFLAIIHHRADLNDLGKKAVWLFSPRETSRFQIDDDEGSRVIHGFIPFQTFFRLRGCETGAI